MQSWDEVLCSVSTSCSPCQDSNLHNHPFVGHYPSLTSVMWHRLQLDLMRVVAKIDFNVKIFGNYSVKGLSATTASNLGCHTTTKCPIHLFWYDSMWTDNRPGIYRSHEKSTRTKFHWFKEVPMAKLLFHFQKIRNDTLSLRSTFYHEKFHLMIHCCILSSDKVLEYSLSLT